MKYLPYIIAGALLVFAFAAYQLKHRNDDGI